MQKREYLTAIFGGIAVIRASVALFQAQPVVAQTQGSCGGVHFRRQIGIDTGASFLRERFQLVDRTAVQRTLFS
jgi:hypothetical protein